MELTQLAIYAVFLLLLCLVPSEHWIQTIAILSCVLIIYQYASTCLDIWRESVRPYVIQILANNYVRFGTLVLLMYGFIYLVLYAFREMIAEVQNRRFWNYKYKDVQFVRRITQEQYQEQAENYTRKRIEELSADLEHNYY